MLAGLHKLQALWGLRRRHAQGRTNCRTHQRVAPSRTHRGDVFASVDLRGPWRLWRVGDIEVVIILLLWGAPDECSCKRARAPGIFGVRAHMALPTATQVVRSFHVPGAQTDRQVLVTQVLVVSCGSPLRAHLRQHHAYLQTHDRRRRHGAYICVACTIGRARGRPN